MPGLVPPVTDEREMLLAFLGQQRDALRYAAHGLTDEQADEPPFGERTQRGRDHQARVPGGTSLGDLPRAQATPACSRSPTTTPTGSASSRARRSRTSLALAAEQAGGTEKVVSGIDDLGASLPPTTDVVPWIPAGLRWTPRWVLLHLIEEMARHAGHADIVRESLDNATCWTLMAAAEGWSMEEWAE